MNDYTKYLTYVIFYLLFLQYTFLNLLTVAFLLYRIEMNAVGFLSVPPTDKNLKGLRSDECEDHTLKTKGLQTY
jgi:hypothetical protein